MGSDHGGRKRITDRNAPVFTHTSKDSENAFAFLTRFLILGALVVGVAAMRARGFGTMGPPPLLVRVP